MSQHRILRRLDFDRSASSLPPAVLRKADWAMLQLGAQGRTPSTKGTVGLNAAWRRSPVQGSHFYLWWIPASDSGIEWDADTAARRQDAGPTILVHSIRHHDETDSPIEIGSLNDYEPVTLGLIDPRFEEQLEVSQRIERNPISFAAIEGMPGSGKSVALLFLARDLAMRPGVHKLRYITYSEKLKRDARELFRSLSEEISAHITVHTVNDVVRELLRDAKMGSISTSSLEPDLQAFVRELDHMNPALLGAWRNYPYTLYTELRAHVIGRAFPEGYTLPKHRDAALRRSGSEIDVTRYARQRKLDDKSAQIAVQQGARLRDRFFTDQLLALRALQRLLDHNHTPTWLGQTDAIIVDEVQDLTLLQIALVGEMAHARRRRHPERPFALTIAGDESQIVQPTGFQWGVTKDVLAGRLDVFPSRFEFRTQRRSPSLLARLVENSWSLYAQLPKDLRPSAHSQTSQSAGSVASQTARANEDAPAGSNGDNELEQGMIAFVITPDPASDLPESHAAGLGSAEEWRDLLQVLDEKPGRVLIDLNGDIARLLPAQVSTDTGGETRQGSGNQVLFDPREIKGLERATVLVAGLQALYARVQALLTDQQGDRIAQMEARRLIDHLRVAISRSTSRLIFLDAPDAPVFKALALRAEDAALALDRSGIIELLRADEMTELEMVEALLDEAEDLGDRNRSADARARNRRASELAEQLGIRSIRERASRQYIELLLTDAERAVEAGNIASATNHLSAAIDEVGAAHLSQRHPRFLELQERVTAASHGEFEYALVQARRLHQDTHHAEALEAAQKALQLASSDEGNARREEALALLDQIRLAWVLALAQERAIPANRQAATILRAPLPDLAPLDNNRALLYMLFAVQFERLADASPLTPNQLPSLLNALAPVVEKLAEFAQDAELSAIVAIWLDDLFASLNEHFKLYLPWAELAQQAERHLDYPMLDERIWDLENRWTLAGKPMIAGATDLFEAFLTAYNGDHAQASLLWERAGDMDRAIAAARAAGDLERAQSLLRQLHRPVPEEIATSVKLMRLAQQLQQKHVGLTDAERRTLLEEIAHLHTHISTALLDTILPDEG